MGAPFREQPHARARGKAGEDDAVRWLEGQGYKILARNVTNHGGEIDVVAIEGPTRGPAPQCEGTARRCTPRR